MCSVAASLGVRETQPPPHMAMRGPLAGPLEPSAMASIHSRHPMEKTGDELARSRASSFIVSLTSGGRLRPVPRQASARS
jgi:hypothetical protein